jgi:hypothetical protein
MIEWAMKYPEGAGVLVFCAIVAITVIGVAFAIAWGTRK